LYSNIRRPFISGTDYMGTTSINSCHDGRIRLVDIEISSDVRVFKAHENVRVWAVNPLNEQVFASSGDEGYVKFWDIRSPYIIGVLGPHFGRVSQIAYMNNILFSTSSPNKNKDDDSLYSTYNLSHPSLYLGYKKNLLNMISRKNNE